MADIEKQWNVTSGNPRDSHAAIDGETVPYDEPFSNGLMYPGDPTGDVGEVAGCTCVMTITGEAQTQPQPEVTEPTPAAQAELEAPPVDSAFDIASYTSGQSQGINEFLRTGEWPDYMKDDRFAIKLRTDTMNGLDAAFAEAPRATEPFTTYRGISTEGGFGNILEGWQPGDVIQDNGFISTTLDENATSRFGDWKAAITVEKDTPYLDTTQSRAGITGEAELILPRGTQFEVVAKDEASKTIELRTLPQVQASVGAPSTELAPGPTRMEWLHDRAEWIRTLDPETQKIANDWESTHLNQVNGDLRQYGELQDQALPGFDIDAKLETQMDADTLLAHGQTADGTEVWYRGMRGMSLQVGDTFVDHAYPFMTESPGLARQFAAIHDPAQGAVMRLHLEPGIRSFYGNYADMYEHIGETGLQFEITGESSVTIPMWEYGSQVQTDVRLLDVTVSRVPGSTVDLPVPTPAPAVDYTTWSNAQLRAELSSRGMPTSYLKPRLIEMLQEDDKKPTLGA